MRGIYDLPANAFCRVAEHLLGMPHVVVEAWEQVKDAVDLHRRGFDFADALQWASARHCERLVTFDDRHYARCARAQHLVPPVTLAR